MCSPRELAAHAVTHERIEAAGVTLLFRFSGAASIPAHARVLIFSPGSFEQPYLETETDAKGYVSFIPDTDGTWRLELKTKEGHEKAISLEVGADEVIASKSKLPKLLLLGSLVANVLLLARIRKLSQRASLQSAEEMPHTSS